MEAAASAVDVANSSGVDRNLVPAVAFVDRQERLHFCAKKLFRFHNWTRALSVPSSRASSGARSVPSGEEFGSWRGGGHGSSSSSSAPLHVVKNQAEGDSLSRSATGDRDDNPAIVLSKAGQLPGGNAVPVDSSRCDTTTASCDTDAVSVSAESYSGACWWPTHASLAPFQTPVLWPNAYVLRPEFIRQNHAFRFSAVDDLMERHHRYNISLVLHEYFRVLCAATGGGNSILGGAV